MTEFGVIIASEPQPYGWAGIGGLAADVEASGLDALWFTDHLFWHHPTPDPIASIAIATEASKQIDVGSMVLQLPLRQTAAVAKTFGFLNRISGGRTVLGVGVGEHEDEYRAAGVGDRFRRRGRHLDRAIDELRDHWAGGGESPMAPVHPVPIWVGGRSTAARRRAVTSGDAWIPHLVHIRWFVRNAARFLEEVAAAERSEPPRLGASIIVHVEDVEPEGDPLGWIATRYRLPPKAFAPILISGPANEVATRLRAFVDAGATHLALLPAGDRPLDHTAAILAEFAP